MSFCAYYDAHECRSCGWIDYHYSEQLSLKSDQLQALLNPFNPHSYLKPVTSQLLGFRNKAKMVAIPTASGIILGLDSETSLVACGLYDVSMQRLLEYLQTWLNELGIKGYDIAKKKGELKYVLLTRSTYNGSMMLRFVLRSHGIIARLQKGLSALQEVFPDLKVVTANIQPIHMAILEGDEEIFLTDAQWLEEQFNGIPLYIRPKSFFQTNPEVASKLYKIAAEWVNEEQTFTVWDLFCRVGGFALHCHAPDRQIVGIEIESEAIECAKASAEKLGIESLEFKALDAASFMFESQGSPDVLIVNPPRRGLGEQLCKWITKIKPARIIYSSCNSLSLSDDLKRLADYTPNRVQLFDMFPHTAHYETLVELVKINR